MWTNGAGLPCGGSATGLNSFTVGIQQINGGDPLSEMAALGHANLNTAFELLTISMGADGLSALLGKLSTKGKGVVLPTVSARLADVLGAAGPMVTFIASIFMVCGFTLAYILPMFPFTRFFFAVLVWVAAVLEAVVAVPLIALAHLNPEGEGLPGQSAKAAYFYVFNILLRPILMIFGLVCGLLLFLIAVSFLTYTYNLAVASSGGTAYGHEMMSKIIYSIMYVAMMYICANHSFQLIDHIPEKALSWLGQQAPSMAQVGNAGHLQNTEQLVGGYIGQQMGQNLGQGAKGLSDALAGNGPASKALAAQKAADRDKAGGATQHIIKSGK
jgi:conjugal transfer/type IV secretion protein DotA/TraY